MRRILLVLIGVAVAAAVAFLLLRPPTAEPVQASLDVSRLLGAADTAGYARAVEPRAFDFPADHGPHPAFRTEWWYFTGNLKDRDGRRFGYQLTFFRNAISPDSLQTGSSWRARDIYMAHFAVTDATGARFHAFERFARAAQELAGASADPFRVWVEDWSAAAVGAGSTFPIRLNASEARFALDLVLQRGKPPVAQGDRGLSQKGPQPGNASHYYSLTRMPTQGTIAISGRRFAVSGLSWMDREWSTSALSDGQEGWDWFALQLDDGSEVMLYRIRRSGGGTDPFSGGVVVPPAGDATPLSAADFRLSVLDRWTSGTGAEYPSRWRLRIPEQRVDLEITPATPDQELNLAVRYWEGAVDVRGVRGGAAVRGRGYVELTGYGTKQDPALARGTSQPVGKASAEVAQ